MLPRLPKLAAFDIDGTLVSQNLPNTSPSPRTVQALLDLKKQGVIIVIATGRPTEHTLSFCKRTMPFVDYVIGHDGQRCYNFQTESLVFDSRNGLDKIKKALIDFVVAFRNCSNYPPAFVLELEDGRSNTGQTRSKFITDTDPATHSFDWRPWYQMPYYSAVQLDDILSVLHQKNETLSGGAGYSYGIGGDGLSGPSGDVLSLFAIFDIFEKTKEGKQLMMEGKVSRGTDGEVTKFDSGLIHCTIKDLDSNKPGSQTIMKVAMQKVDKWTALSKLSLEIGIDKKEVVCFGNDLNDIGMLKWAEIGYVTDDAPNEVLKAGNVVMGSVEKEGVAVVIEGWLSKRRLGKL